MDTEAENIFKMFARRHIEHIMGRGKKIRHVFDLVEDYAKQDTPLLVEGEIGVGKREIVNYLHLISKRNKKELVTVDCGTIPESLIEAELFGSKKGAYTDSKEDRKGKIEIANGGILFLDELNSLSKHMQIKLLRFIQEKEITRVGDTKPIKIDVRIIAAGNENFKDLIKNDRFRRDIYERFAVKVRVPTLAERKEDIDFFIDRFIEEKANELGKKGVRIDKEAKNVLKNHSWEGNVRQLMNFIHKLVILVKQTDETNAYIIDLELVRNHLCDELVLNEETPEYMDFTWKTALTTARKNAIERALKESGWNNEKAIELLGITRGTFYTWKKTV